MFNFYSGAYSNEGFGLLLKREVLIKNVYPGIDWKLMISDADGINSFKYEFIVHPGANAANIQLGYSDNAQLKQNINGGIDVKTHLGSFGERKPEVCIKEGHRPVTSSFSVVGNILAFSLQPYDKNETIVIDPDVFWATYFTSISPSNGYIDVIGKDIRSDKAGNIFVQLSVSSSINFPTLNAGNGAFYQDYQSAPNGGMVLMKFSRGGKLLWSTYFTAENETGGFKMTVDDDDNIIASGQFMDNVDGIIPLLDNGGYFDPVEKRNFLVRFDNNCKLIWCTYFASFETYISDATFDAKGNFYFVGRSTSYEFPTVDPGNGAYCVVNPQFGYAYVFFVSQFNSKNELTWSTRIEGNDHDDLGLRINADNLGNLYLIGSGRSTNYPLVNAGGYFLTTGGATNITKFDSNRKMVWATYYPSTFGYQDITTDKDGNVYIVAQKRIAKFDVKTNLVWEKEIAFPKQYFLSDIEYDKVNDQLQVVGVMNSTYYGFPTQNTTCPGSFFNDGQHLTHPSATGPIFLTFDTDGNFTYLSLANWIPEYYDHVNMAVDPFGDILYLFGDNSGAFTKANKNPDLKNPGSGAYYDEKCTDQGTSSLLFKLTSSAIAAKSKVTAPTGCLCNGSISITPQCGTAPFTYLWDRGDVTQSLTKVCQGNYSVTITDSKGLSTILNFNVPAPANSITSITKKITAENCGKSDGTITIPSVTGGVAPYLYSLNGGFIQKNNVFTALDSGTYTLVIKDVNGCIFSDTAIIEMLTGPTQIFYSLSAGSCKGDDGKIIIDSIKGGSAPYTYSLNNLQNTTGIFEQLAPAVYILEVADINGCSYSSSVEILAAKPPTAAGLSIESEHCNLTDAAIKITSVSGGKAPYSFSTDGSVFTPDSLFSNLTSGDYTVYIKDANGCILEKENLTIQNVPGPAAVNYNITDASCGLTNGRLEIVSADGGSTPYSFAIDSLSYSAAQVFSKISEGPHSIQVKDYYGCVLSKNLMIIRLPFTNISLTPNDTTACYNSPVMFSLNNGKDISNITWNVPGSATSVEVKATSDLNIIASGLDSNGCKVSATSVLHVYNCSLQTDCILFATAFTPDNDGVNDDFGAF